MSLRGPRTLLGLILSGLALVAFPLLIAIGNAALRLGELTSDSENVLQVGAATTLENRRLDTILINMERNARRYLLLQDADSLALYQEDEAAMNDSLIELSSLPQTAETIELLQFLSAEVKKVDEIIYSEPAENLSEAVIESFRRIDAAAEDVDRRMQEAISERLETLQSDASQAQEMLAWQAAALVPLTIVLVVLFLVYIARPMRKIDRAIRELGDGEYGNPIEVSGPRDINTLGQQLEWLRGRLEESANEKNKFLRHMSHELKTPLANIREGSELLIDGAVGSLHQDQEEVADILRLNSIKLQTLIENLLTFSAWQGKAATLEKMTFDLKPVVFSAVSQHRLAIANRKIKLQIQAAPLTIYADASKVRLILDNLVSNAVKFTPEGGAISVRTRLEGSTLVIDVSDSGPGIAEQDRARIFEAFYQGHRPQGGPVGGTGIGLSIVRECAQVHGGTVELVNTDLPGAHFHVRLPLEQDQAEGSLVANAS
jgi:two-component system sensor histidine kinase GlrK